MGLFNKFKRSGEKSEQEQISEVSDLMSDALLRLDAQVNESADVKNLIRSKMGITDETEIRAYGVAMLWSKQLADKGVDQSVIKNSLVTALPIMYHMSAVKAEGLVTKVLSRL